MDIQKIKDQQGDEGAPSKAAKTHKIFIGGYVLFALASLAMYWLVKENVIEISNRYQDTLQKVFLGCFFGFVILTIARICENIITHQSKLPFARYNLIKAIRLLAIMLIILVAVSLLELW